VDRLVHPAHREQRDHPALEVPHGRQAEPPLQQGRRFEQHVVGGEQGAVAAQESLEGGHRGVVGWQHQRTDPRFGQLVGRIGLK